MKTASDVQPRETAPGLEEAGAALLIAVPFYRNEHLVDAFVISLLNCAAELNELNARVVLYNDSPGYAPLGAALQEALEGIGAAFRVEVRTNAENIGWLATCNLAMGEALNLGADVLLFNSDTVVFPGAVTEMLRVAQIDPMIGFVNPRSNNATLASLPVGPNFVRMPPVPAHTAYRAVVRTFPELTYTPTAIGFALLIKRQILAEFGFFDPVYGRGYNEENDLVMRASRAGYRSAIANRAYVWHQGEQSFGSETDSKAQMEAGNRAILEKRYPEYGRLINMWRDSVEHRAELLLSALVPDSKGRLRIALDFSTFGPYHSGTQKSGVQLLKAMAASRRKYDLFVLCPQDVYEFHGLDKIGVERRDPHDPEVFAAIFRVGQPFDWDAMRRCALKGAIVGVFMLDTISIDSGHLRSSGLYDLWQYTINHSDFIVYNSAFTERQFRSRFANADRRRRKVSLHSLDLADYAPAGFDNSDLEVSEKVRSLSEGFALVVGNHYPHKGVGDAANRLAQAFPDLSIVAIGLTREPSKATGASFGEPAPLGPLDNHLLDLPNLVGFPAGQMSDADIEILQRKARVIIMPSHYEGFGFPMLTALAAGKPFVARDIPALREVHARLGHNPNVHFFATTDELLRIMRNPPAWTNEGLPPPINGDAARTASDVFGLIDASIADASYGSILDRFRILHTVFSVPHNGMSRGASGQPSNNPDSAAHRLGAFVERASRPLFRTKAFYHATRFIYRAGRAVGINK